MLLKNIISISVTIVHMMHIFVQHFFGKIYDSLKIRGIKFNEHWIWSNGCASQFKSSRSCFLLCQLHMKTYIKNCWNLFETGHGKGEHDGAWACIKRELRRYQMDHSAKRLVSVEEFVQWCITALSHETNQSREM